MIESIGKGYFKLKGALTFETVPEILRASSTLFAEADHLKVDLADVSQGDSTGVALLLAWIRQAKVHKKSIVFTHIPSQLLMIAKVSNLDDFLVMHG